MEVLPWGFWGPTAKSPGPARFRAPDFPVTLSRSDSVQVLAFPRAVHLC